MQDACLGPLLCWLKKTSWSGRATIRRSLPGLSRPHPRLHRHHRHPLPARKAPRPRRKAERSSVRPLPSPQVRFPPSVCGKESSCGKGNTQKTDPVEPCLHAIPSCCDGGVSLMRRDRSFRGRLPGGPDIGLPVFLRLFQNGFRWCHRFPCCATVLPIRPKCS